MNEPLTCNVSFKWRPSGVAKLKKLAAKFGMDQSEILRRSLAVGMKSFEKVEPLPGADDDQ